MNTVKLEDIARELNLSVSTVSRAISGKGRVGDRTRARVQAAVRESGYRINDVARSLRMQKAQNMGIIVPDISNAFFASVIKGAQQRCQESGYTLFVCNSDENPDIETETLEMLLSKQVSGLVLASVREREAIIGQYGSLDIPIVYIDNIPQGADLCDCVSIDNYAASKRLTLAMIDRGYRELGMITGPQSQSSGYLRKKGFEAALAERGLPVRPEWLRVGTFTSVAVHWLPGMIKIFQQDHPNIEFRLLNGDYHDVENWLTDGSIDVGFVALPSRVECRTIPLREDRLLAILPKDHPKAGLDRYPLSEIGQEDFISLLKNSDQDARRAMELAGVRPNIKFTTKDDYAIIAMVENGLGVSIVPELRHPGFQRHEPCRAAVRGICLPLGGRTSRAGEMSAYHKPLSAAFLLHLFSPVPSFHCINILLKPLSPG